MADELKNHGKIPGSKWDAFHGGYFSNKDAAAPLVLAALGRPLPPPAVIADLGGGTGFILKEIADRLTNPSVRLINIDLSESQLNESHAGQNICTIRCPIGAVKREALFLESGEGGEGGTLLFIMRSVLHYFGRGGIGDTLSHIRRQMRPGECFIHQSACFQTDAHTVLLNELYRSSGIDKWFPAVNELNEVLCANGFTQVSVEEAMSLPVTSRDYAERYGLYDDKITETGQSIKAKYGEIPGVFETGGGSGFTFYLHYRIFTSEAV